jgi:hypothetical protein
MCPILSVQSSRERTSNEPSNVGFDFGKAHILHHRAILPVRRVILSLARDSYQSTRRFTPPHLPVASLLPLVDCGCPAAYKVVDLVGEMGRVALFGPKPDNRKYGFTLAACAR